MGWGWSRLATAPPRLAARLRPGLDAAVALGVVATVGLDRMNYVWLAGAPWVNWVFQSIIVSSSLVGLSLLVLWGALLDRPELPAWAPLGARLVVGAGGVLLATTAASTRIAPVPLLSLARFGAIILGLLVYWTVAHRPRLAHRLVDGFGALIVVNFPLVLLQELTQSTYPYGMLTGAPGELSARAPGASVVFARDGTRWMRAMGSFIHPNVLGGFLAVTLVLSLVWLGPRRRPAWPLVATWALGWLELALSFSRTALIAAVLGTAIWLLACRGVARLIHVRPDHETPSSEGRRLAVLAAGAALAAIVALAVAGPVLPRWMVLRPGLLTEQSATQRELIDGVALSMIRAHPLSGVGAGNFSLATLAPPYNAVMVDPAHAVPLLVAAESGAPAGLAWLALVFAAPADAVRRGRPRALGDAAAVAATLLTLALLDHYLWTLPPGVAVFWIALGIVAARGGRPEDPAEASP